MTEERIDSIWSSTLKKKASEILVHKVKPIFVVKIDDLDSYFVFEYRNTQLILRFNFKKFSEDHSLIWRGDDNSSYQKMVNGGFSSEYKKYFDNYSIGSSGELVFLIEHKLMMTILFQQLGKCCVRHQLVCERPMSRRRLTGPYSQLVSTFQKIESENYFIDFQKSQHALKESDILYLKNDEKIVELLFFLSKVNSVMRIEKLNEVISFVVDMNLRVRELIQNPNMDMKNLLLEKNYAGFSAVSQLFRRVMLVYCRLFEMIGQEDWTN